MSNLAKIPPRYTTNIFKGGKKKYLKLAAEWMKKNGGKIGGFTKVHGYLKGKNASDKMTVFGISSKGTLLDKLQSLGLKQEAEVRRKQRIAEQTGEVEKFDWKNKPKGFDGHHRRMVALYAPFYEGLNDKEKKELTQWFIEEGFPLGDAKENLALLLEDDHTGAEDSIHKWMRENNIQVRPGKPGESNFVFGKDGKIDFVRGGSDLGSSKAKEGTALMPNLSHLSLNERLYPAAAYLENVQIPVEEQLSKYTAKTNLDKKHDEMMEAYNRGQESDANFKTGSQELLENIQGGAQTLWNNTVGQIPLVATAKAGFHAGKGEYGQALSSYLNMEGTTIEPLAKRSEYKAIQADVSNYTKGTANRLLFDAGETLLHLK